MKGEVGGGGGGNKGNGWRGWVRQEKGEEKVGRDGDC